jgi:hypothetical protein
MRKNEQFRQALIACAYVSETKKLPEYSDASLGIATHHIKKILGTSSYSDKVNGWLKNGPLTSHRFPKSVLETLLENWIGKIPFLMTKEDVDYFLSLGLPEFVDVKYFATIRPLYHSLPDGPRTDLWEKYSEPDVFTVIPSLPAYYIARPGFEKSLLDKFSECKRLHQPLLIYGAQDSGKTTAMIWISVHPDIKSIYSGRRLWIRGDYGKSIQDWLILLQSQLFPYKERLNSLDVAELMAHIKSKTANDAWLLLLDDCDCKEFIQELPDLLNEQSAAVITVRTDSSAHLSAPNQCRIQSKKFEGQESLALYTKIYDPNLSKQDFKMLRQFDEFLNGNPLALKITWAAWHTSDDPAEIITQLESQKNGEPASAALAVWYQFIPEKSQMAFRQLGALPSLATFDCHAAMALWNVGCEQAQNYLTWLQDAFLIDVISPGIYSLSDSIIDFAKQKLNENHENVNVEIWLQRYSQIPEIEQRFLEFRRIVSFQNPIQNYLSNLRHGIAYQKPLLVRTWKSFWTDNKYSSDWDVTFANSRIFSSQMLVFAFIHKNRAADDYKNFNRWVLVGLVLAFFLGIFWDDLVSLPENIFARLLFFLAFALLVVFPLSFFHLLKSAWRDSVWVAIWDERDTFSS